MPSTTTSSDTAGMTETEFLLRQARDIATRTFQDPTEETVMEIWRRLCYERDMTRHAHQDAVERVLH